MSDMFGVASPFSGGSVASLLGMKKVGPGVLKPIGVKADMPSGYGDTPTARPVPGFNPEDFRQQITQLKAAPQAPLPDQMRVGGNMGNVAAAPPPVVDTYNLPGTIAAAPPPIPHTQPAFGPANPTPAPPAPVNHASQATDWANNPNSAFGGQGLDFGNNQRLAQALQLSRGRRFR